MAYRIVEPLPQADAPSGHCGAAERGRFGVAMSAGRRSPRRPDPVAHGQPTARWVAAARVPTGRPGTAGTG